MPMFIINYNMINKLYVPCNRFLDIIIYFNIRFNISKIIQMTY